MKPRICKNISSLSVSLIISSFLFHYFSQEMFKHRCTVWLIEIRTTQTYYFPQIYSRAQIRNVNYDGFADIVLTIISSHIFLKNTYLICISMVCTILSAKGLVKSELQTGETNWLQHLTSWLHYELTRIFYRRGSEEGRGDKPINSLWKNDMAIHNVFKQIF